MEDCVHTTIMNIEKKVIGCKNMKIAQLLAVLRNLILTDYWTG